ncbi:MAG: glucokinase, partial [Chthonomonadales bacterium]|nr:glucokinase [Chthonomonadales bacterium]
MSQSRITPNSSASYVVGVDLGGTNVRAAVLDRHEQSLGRHENTSDAKDGGVRTVGRIAAPRTASAIRPTVPLDKIGAVGIAVPGHIDVPASKIVWAPNFGHFDDGLSIPFRNVSLRDMQEDELKLPGVMGNDANVTALGEFRFGAGRGARHFVMFTLGTGIGGGIIIEGEVLHGATGIGVVDPEYAHDTMAGLNFVHAVAQAIAAGKLSHIDLNGQKPGRYDQNIRFGVEDLKANFIIVKLLEDSGYSGMRHFDAHVYRTEDEARVWAFANEPCERWRRSRLMIGNRLSTVRHSGRIVGTGMNVGTQQRDLVCKPGRRVVVARKDNGREYFAKAGLMAWERMIGQ